MTTYAEDLADLALCVADWLKKLYQLVKREIICFRWLSRRERQMRQRMELISQSFYTSEGRDSLADAMVAPIRRALDYQGVGRRLLMVDELPQGAYSSYSNGVSLTYTHLCNICGDRTGECDHLSINRGGDYFEQGSTAQELRDTGMVAHYHSSEIYVSNMMDQVDRVNNVASQVINDFNEELDRDTQSVNPR